MKLRPLIVLLCAGCAPAGFFSHAALPHASWIETARVEKNLPPASEASLLHVLKVSFYKSWITEFGVRALPATVQSFDLKPGDPVTLESVASAMADGESSLSALQLIQVTPQVLNTLSASVPPDQMREFTAIVDRYQEPIRRRVERVGTRVAEAAKRPDISFSLEPALGLNAAAPHALNAKRVLVGPQIVLLAESDDELAAILGHEVAHITHGHTRAGAIRDAAITTLQVTAMVAVAVAAANSNKRMSPQQVQSAMVGAAALTGIAAQGAVTASGYTRDNERDADYYGVQLASQAGYDPLGAVRIFSKLAMVEKGISGRSRVPFLVDHPGTAERVVRVTKEVGRLRAPDGELAAVDLACWTVPIGGVICRTCCAGTGSCLTDCGG